MDADGELINKNNSLMAPLIDYSSLSDILVFSLQTFRVTRNAFRSGFRQLTGESEEGRKEGRRFYYCTIQLIRRICSTKRSESGFKLRLYLVLL